MLKNKVFKKAFTLVEMLIVVIIIGILMGALLPKLKGAQERARDTARKANLSTISTALEMYFNDNGTYPTGSCLSNISNKLVPTYVSELPSDPQKGRIAYGTKDGGCNPGEYAYTSLWRKGSVDAGAVTIANVEAQGSVGNFILPQDGNTATAPGSIFSGTENIINGNAIGSDASIGLLDDVKMKAASTNSSGTHLIDADIAAKFTCSTTAIVSIDSTMCNRVSTTPGPIIDGKALINNAMVYVLFN